MSGRGNAQVGRGKLRPSLFRIAHLPGVGAIPDRHLTPWDYLETSRWFADRGRHRLAARWAATHRKIVWSRK
jgi:hypothetical protein